MRIVLTNRAGKKVITFSRTGKNTSFLFGCLLALAGTASVASAATALPKAEEIVFLGGLPIHVAAAEPVALAVVIEARIFSPDEPAIDQQSTAAIPRAETRRPEGVFGSVRIAVGHFPAVERWQRVHASMTDCKGKGCGKAEAMLSGIAGKAGGKRFLDKLNSVNLAVNEAVRYQPDQRNYGQRDYWAEVNEIVARGRGDCEDYAILKMAALLRAGVPERSMSVVVLYDNGHRAFHAVLAVATDQGNFILDNLRADVYLDADQPGYQPLYSLGAGKAWLHGTRASAVASLDGLADIAPGEGFLAE